MGFANALQHNVVEVLRFQGFYLKYFEIDFFFFFFTISIMHYILYNQSL